MKLIIGFITYNDLTAKYLPDFLSSLQTQTFSDYKIIALDNSESKNNANVDIMAHHPEIAYEQMGENLGYARAYNRLLRQALEMEAEYFLALNPDMIFEPDFLDKLVAGMDNNPELGSASPKILRWDFADQQKTDIIDTCGIVMRPGLRFVDIAQGEADNGQQVNFKILGPSGAAAIYRMSALKAAEQPNGFFDEIFFMYKEDADLAYRLSLKGFSSECIVSAVAYHDRSASAIGESNLKIALNRKNKSERIKRWSFLNQQIIFYKFWSLQSSWDKLAILWFELRAFVFVILFERYLLEEIKHFFQIKNSIIKYKV